METLETAKPSRDFDVIAKDDVRQSAPKAQEPKAGGFAKRRAKAVLLFIAAAAAAGALVLSLHHHFIGQYLKTTNDARISADSVEVSPRISGYVARVFVADNQDVSAGQPLLEIDTRDYRAQAAQAQAQVALASAGVDNIRASIREQYAVIEQLQAQLAAAQSKAAADAAEAARYRPLAESGAEPRERFAQLSASAAQSAANARAQKAALAAQERRIASLETQVRQNEAQVEAARARLEAVKVDLDAALIRAPIAGRVGDRSVEAGQFARAGSRLMSLVPLEEIYVVANFKETQVGLMRPGQPASVKVDALKSVGLNGRVVSISPGTKAQFSLFPPENATGNFTKIVQRVPVRIALRATPELRRLLIPGLSATVKVDTSSAQDSDEVLKRRQRQFAQQGSWR